MVEGSREERLANRPNILFFHVDNLGFGELSCYSGGPFRGATTTRIDAFAQQGVRLTNYCPESQCTPTRSAPLTGRHAVRSGTHSVPLGASGGWGLVAWEKTIAELLPTGGYGVHLLDGPRDVSRQVAQLQARARRTEVYERYRGEVAHAAPHQSDHRSAGARSGQSAYLHSWTAARFNRILAEFESSVHREPLIPAGAPVDHKPSTGH